ncbi:hypothetical protein ACRCUN_02810 [Mycobacterium sp. LTG2003]
MTSRRLPRRLAATAGLAALIAMGGFAVACGTGGEEAPSTPTTTTTTTTTTTAPSVEPTEKGLNPDGGNKFTPTHIVTPAPPTGGGKGGH